MFIKKRFGKRRRLNRSRRLFRRRKFRKSVMSIARKTGERKHFHFVQTFGNITSAGKFFWINQIVNGTGNDEIVGRKAWHETIFLKFYLFPDGGSNWNYEICPVRCTLFWWKDNDTAPNVNLGDANCLFQYYDAVANPLIPVYSPFNNVCGRKLKVIYDHVFHCNLQNPVVFLKLRRRLMKNITFYEDEGVPYPEWRLYFMYYVATPDQITLDAGFVSRLSFRDA